MPPEPTWPALPPALLVPAPPVAEPPVVMAPPVPDPPPWFETPPDSAGGVSDELHATSPRPSRDTQATEQARVFIIVRQTGAADRYSTRLVQRRRFPIAPVSEIRGRLARGLDDARRG